MHLIIFAALVAAGGAAKLDRSYLPPASAATAGGSAEHLQLPVPKSNEVSQNVPAGGFINDHQGVVVEAASVGTRTSDQQSGLGGPRVTYGATESKVGDAAFRVQNQGSSIKLGHQGEPDLSAFQRPPSSSSGNKPSGNKQVTRDPSHTLNYHNSIGLNNFNYAFETNNGIKIAQNGLDMDGALAQGGYSYIGDDGKEYSVTYIADKDGYRAQGSHLPTPPPIPREILLALERNAKDEAAGIFDDGSYDAKKYNVDYDYNEANKKYNDRHSHKFGDQPVHTSAFINQHQQGFVKPSSNRQFGLNSDSKDSSFSKPDSSKGSSSQSSSRFGSNGPTKTNVRIQSNIKQKESQSSLSSMNLDSSHSAKPLSQQNLQVQKTEKPSFMRPTSYDVSVDGLSTISVSSRPSSSSSPSALNQAVTNSFNSYNKGSSFDQSSVKKPAQESFNSRLVLKPNLNKTQIILNKYNQNALNMPTTSQTTTGNYISKSTPPIPTTNIQSNQNIHFLGPQPTGMPISSSLGQYLQNGPILNQFTSSLSTRKPQVTLTTPLATIQTTNAGVSSTQFENFKTQDPIDTKMPDVLSTINRFVTQPGLSTTNGDYSTTYTGNFISSSNTQTDRTSPIFGTQTTQSQEHDRQTFQLSQAQAPDHSYLYNRPSKPFESSMITTDSDVFSTTSNLNGVSPSSKPQLSTSSLKPQSTLYYTKDQNIGVTQADISTFPSNLPISPDFKQQIQSVFTFSQASPLSTTASDERTTFPDNQKLTTLFEKQTEDIQNEPAPIKTQQNVAEVYQYPKPTETLSTNTNQPYDVTVQQQFNQDSEAQIKYKPSTSQPTLSQATLDALNAVFSQTGYQSFSRPTEEHVRFDKLTTSSLSLETQPAGFNGQKPVTQPDSSNFFTSSQLSTQSENQQTTSTVGLENFTNKDTTPFGTRFGGVPTSSQTQTNSLSTPSESQSGQTTAFTSDFSTNMPLQSTQFNIKTEPENDSKLTSYFQQQSTTSFNMPSTIPPSSFDTQTPIARPESGQIYDYTRPAQEFTTSSQREIQTKPELQFSQPSAQEVRPSEILSNVHIGENTIPDSDQLSTHMPTHTEPMNRFGQYSISKLSTTQSETGQPSTILFTEPSSTPSSIPSQSQTASLEFGQIYDYNKPANGFISTSQKELELPHRFNTQFGQEALTSTQKMSTPFATLSTSGQFGENTISNSDYKSTNMPQQTTQFNTQYGEYSNTKLTTSLSTTDFDSQSHTTSADLREVYDYKKPTTVFISTSKNEYSGQTISQLPFSSPSTTQFTEQTLSNNLHSSHFSTSSFTEKDKMTTNFANAESVTPENLSTYSFPSTREMQSTLGSENSGQIYEYRKPEQGLLSPAEKEGTTTSSENKEYSKVTQTTVTQIGETTTTLSLLQETPQELSGLRQQFSFHRTCCSSSVFKDLDHQIKDGNLKDKDVNKQNLESKVNDQAHFGEEFGGPRKPPSFDDSGYHY